MTAAISRTVSSALNTALFTSSEITDAIHDGIAFVANIFGYVPAWRIEISIDLETPILATRTLLNRMASSAEMQTVSVTRTHKKTCWIAAKTNDFQPRSIIDILEILRPLEEDLGQALCREFKIPTTVCGHKSLTVSMRQILVKKAR